MRRAVLFIVIVLLTACGGGSVQAIVARSFQCNESSCDGPGARLNVAYKYRLSTHCGVTVTRFDGRTFYVATLYPADLPPGLGNPVDTGTMTLLSSHTAVYRDPAGRSLQFADAPPGVIGKAYPFSVHVLSGGNSLRVETFAARDWQTQGTLPGVSGPPSGNGRDAWTVVPGSFTLKSIGKAVFKSDAGATVEFARMGIGCM